MATRLNPKKIVRVSRLRSHEITLDNFTLNKTGDYSVRFRLSRYSKTVPAAPLAALITLKALANSSPGLLQPWAEGEHKVYGTATLKGLRRGSLLARQSQLLQSCEESLGHILNPEFQSKPWGDARNRMCPR